MHSITVQELIDEYKLIPLTQKNADYSKRLITTADINRPALQLTGFYDYFDAGRVQILGLVENSYLDKMSIDKRKRTLKRFFSYSYPCVVICRGLDAFPEMIKFADESGTPLFQTSETTSTFMSEIIRWMRVQLAPRVTMHGVLVDVYGEGLLIIGESGIGKSETALELIKRGHRLVADDAVEIKRVSSQTLIGSCPEIIRYFIELRGVGIIDVKQMFGVESIKATQNIDLIIKLELWDKTKEYDRLGLKEEYMEILGNNVVCHAIPIRPGRNLAVICESAAINHRQKKLGYHSAKALSERVDANFKNK